MFSLHAPSSSFAMAQPQDGNGKHHLPLSSSTTKIPPGWSPEHDRRYSAIQYKRDLRMWYQTTELQDTAIGPAMALRLEGVARRIAEEIASQPSNVDTHPMSSRLSHGHRPVEPVSGAYTGPAETGWSILLQEINNRFGALQHERLIQYLMDLFSF